MAIDSELALRTFLPTFHESLQLMEREKLKLAYYTRFETALQIIEGRSIWMRNTKYMNDIGEIQHGIDAVDAFFAKNDNRRRLYAVLGSHHFGILEAIWRNQKHHLVDEVYITCVSQHWPREDASGRLSMWRAYCAQPDGVALVLNTEPFHLTTDEFKAYASSVLYGDAADFEQRALEVLDNIEREKASLTDPDEVVQHLARAILYGALCLKHPGFKEEEEWRVIHMPLLTPSGSRLRRRDGVLNPPQRVYEIPLVNDAKVGLVGLSPGEIIAKIIIGPSARTQDIHAGLVAALAAQGVVNPADRIVTSGIPLRPNPPQAVV